MFAWIKNVVVGLIVASIALGVWKYFGGDFGSFFATVWGVGYGIINALSDVLVSALHAVNTAAK